MSDDDLIATSVQRVKRCAVISLLLGVLLAMLNVPNRTGWIVLICWCVPAALWAVQPAQVYHWRHFKAGR